MRIILSQMEIEEAIEKLILDQVEVPEDQRIDIELKATRGEEGYQAFISIVDHDAPEGTIDFGVDPRITPVSGAENLGIGEKVLAAKAQAAAPRRRGRPLGARNKPKLSTDHRAIEAPQAEEKPENKADIQIEDVEDGKSENLPTEPVDEVTQDVPEEAAIPVADGDQENDVPEAMSDTEAALAAEAARTEPVEEVDYAPTPETAGFETEEAETEAEVEPEAPANPQPTRSLFANLSRPTNG